jgi:hypothetical protein
MISIVSATSPHDRLIDTEASALSGATTPVTFNKSPCDGLTAAEASAILGATTQAPKLAGTVCTYSVSAKEELSVSVMDNAGAMAALLYEQGATDKTAKHSAVSGLGDKADFALSGVNHAIINILSKDRLVILEARGGKKEGLQDSMIEAARKVMSRL